MFASQITRPLSVNKEDACKRQRWNCIKRAGIWKKNTYRCWIDTHIDLIRVFFFIDDVRSTDCSTASRSEFPSVHRHNLSQREQTRLLFAGYRSMCDTWDYWANISLQINNISNYAISCWRILRFNCDSRWWAFLVMVKREDILLHFGFYNIDLG